MLGQLPVDKAKNNRKIIWAAIRKLRVFTIVDLEKETKLNHATISTYVLSLAKGGYLSKKFIYFEGSRRIQHSQYELIKDTGFCHPRVNRQGQDVSESVQNKIWKCIRIHKSLSLLDLEAMLSGLGVTFSLVAIDSYLKMLRTAGYLRKKKGDKNYTLVLGMNTGPLAPQIQKTKQIYDPNLQKVIWSNKREVEDELN